MPIAPFLETVATHLETPEVVLLTEGSRPSDAPGSSPAGSFTRYPHLVCPSPRLSLASTISKEETHARRPSKWNNKGFPCVAHPPVARGMSSQPRQPTYSLFSITKTNTHVSRGSQVPSTEIGRLGGCPSAHGRNTRFGGPRSLKNAVHVSSSTRDRTSDTPSPKRLGGGNEPIHLQHPDQDRFLPTRPVRPCRLPQPRMPSTRSTSLDVLRSLPR